MIYVVSGKVGYGKSYDMTRICADHVRGGGIVATNMVFDLSALRRYCGRPVLRRQVLQIGADMDPAQIPRGDFRGEGPRRVIVVLDECLNWFQSVGAGRIDTKKEEWSAWLRQSDKLGQDVFFIAQNFERAAKWIRELAAVSREIVPLRQVRVARIIPIGYIIPFGSSLYSVIVRDVRGGSVIRIEFHFRTPALYSCYQTAALYGFDASSNAYASIWPRFNLPRICFLLPLACLAVAFLLLRVFA